MAHKKRLEYLVMMENLELPISPIVTNRKQMEASVKKALLAGYFMQIARATDECGNYHIIRDKHTARLSPFYKMDESDWVIYDRFQLTENNTISVVTGVTVPLIAEIVPASYILNLPAGDTNQALVKALHRLQAKNSDQPTMDGEQGSSSNDDVTHHDTD